MNYLRETLLKYRYSESSLVNPELGKRAVKAKDRGRVRVGGCCCYFYLLLSNGHEMIVLLMMQTTVVIILTKAFTGRTQYLVIPDTSI